MDGLGGGYAVRINVLDVLNGTEGKINVAEG